MTNTVKPVSVPPTLRAGVGDLPPAGKAPPAEGNGDPVPGAGSNPLRAELQAMQRGLRFSVDEATGRTVITVVDRATGEVVRQIPSEDLLAIARELRAMAGLLLDERA